MVSETHQVSLDELESHCYCYADGEAINHMLSVSCGLDSMILGEPQIFGQIKNAFQVACEAGSVGHFMHFLFTQLFSATKRVRTDSEICQNPVSLPSAALNLAKCIFTDVNTLNVLLIGVGDMTVSALNYFSDNGAQSITVANRTLSKAQVLAEQHGACAIGLDDLLPALVKADVVITATASTQNIISATLLKQAQQKKRQLRPHLLFDLAVPRDIEPSAGDCEHTYLYNIDDLKEITQTGLAKRGVAAIEARKMIATEVAHCLKLISEREFEDTIRMYREQINVIREQEVAKAIRLLQSGKPADEVLNTMARALTNKLIHQPSVELRQASYHGRTDVIEIAKRLLGIADVEKPNDGLHCPKLVSTETIK